MSGSPRAGEVVVSAVGPPHFEKRFRGSLTVAASQRDTAVDVAKCGNRFI